MKTRMIRILILAVLAITFSIYMVGCMSGRGDSPDTHKHLMATQPDRSVNSTAADDQPTKGEVQIEIEDFVFKPAEVTVAPGTKVTWINKDEAPHTATSTNNKFNSGGLDTDGRFSFVFNDKGEYPYYCALHPHMRATITVK